MSLSRDWLVFAWIVIGLAGCKPNRDGGTVTCTPGAHIWVGCNHACGFGSCTGDPWIGICEGVTDVLSCNDDSRIAENDDSTEFCYSTCPIVQLVCPDSGRITVTLHSEGRRRSAFTCDWRLEERPPALPSDGGVDSSVGGDT